MEGNVFSFFFMARYPVNGPPPCRALGRCYKEFWSIHWVSRVCSFEGRGGGAARCCVSRQGGRAFASGQERMCGRQKSANDAALPGAELQAASSAVNARGPVERAAPRPPVVLRLRLLAPFHRPPNNSFMALLVLLQPLSPLLLHGSSPPLLLQPLVLQLLLPRLQVPLIVLPGSLFSL